MNIKLFVSTMLCAFTLTAALFAAHPEDCDCGDECSCTEESNCGCMSQ